MKTNCMLAQEFDPARIKKYPIAAEDKLDGFRVIFHNGQGYTRGKATTYETFKPFAKAIKEVVGPHVRVDCELMASNWNETSKLLKRKHGLSPARIKAEVQCFVLDLFGSTSNSSLDRKLPHTPYKARRKAVKKVVRDLKALGTGYRFTKPKAVLVKTEKGIQKAFDRARKRGVEGLVFKTLDGVYELKRSFAWMKKKAWRDITVTVVGAIEGKGLCPSCSRVGSTGKKEGCPTCDGVGKVGKDGVLGALVCLTEAGDRIRVGGGISAADRLEWWRTKRKLLGRKLDVKVQETDGADIVARHINFVKWRDDL